jgi:hypothetical protein
MATYRLLEDHYVANQFLSAGSTQSTADVGGVLPIGWKPTPNVEPLDVAAVNAFYAAGPQQPGLIRSQFSGIYIAPPITFWQSIALGDATLWQLTGLGATLAPIWK